MKLTDYDKYYIQGSDHYLIPKDTFVELFNEMSNWREDCKQLKERIDKGIEYIDKHISYECDEVISGMRFCSYHLIYDFRKDDLLDILRGNSNE